MLGAADAGSSPQVRRLQGLCVYTVVLFSLNGLQEKYPSYKDPNGAETTSVQGEPQYLTRCMCSKQRRRHETPGCSSRLPGVGVADCLAVDLFPEIK